MLDTGQIKFTLKAFNISKIIFQKNNVEKFIIKTQKDYKPQGFLEFYNKLLGINQNKNSIYKIYTNNWEKTNKLFNNILIKNGKLSLIMDLSYSCVMYTLLFGGKTSAVNTSKNVVIIPQTLGEVGGATSSNNSNLLANPRMLKKSKSMSNLPKGLIGVGSAAGVVVLANEGLGAFTNADALCKGKISIANGVKYLLAPTLEQRKALFEKISGILNSFGDAYKLTEEQLSHIQAGPECNKAEAAMVMLCTVKMAKLRLNLVPIVS